MVTAWEAVILLVFRVAGVSMGRHRLDQRRFEFELSGPSRVRSKMLILSELANSSVVGPT
jgi:hypothetical protein